MIRITQVPHRGRPRTLEFPTVEAALVAFERSWASAGGLEGMLETDDCYHYPAWDESTDEIPAAVQIVSDWELLVKAAQNDMRLATVIEVADETLEVP